MTVQQYEFKMQDTVDCKIVSVLKTKLIYYGMVIGVGGQISSILVLCLSMYGGWSRVHYW